MENETTVSEIILEHKNSYKEKNYEEKIYFCVITTALYIKIFKVFLEKIKLLFEKYTHRFNRRLSFSANINSLNYIHCK